LFSLQQLINPLYCGGEAPVRFTVKDIKKTDDALQCPYVPTLL